MNDLSRGSWIAEIYDLPTQRSLLEIARLTALSARLVARGFTGYEADEALPLAAEAVVLKIGEAAALVSDDFVSQHPELRLRAIEGARNLIAFRYEAVDTDLLWATISNDLPALGGAVDEILDRFSDTAPAQARMTG